MDKSAVGPAQAVWQFLLLPVVVHFLTLYMMNFFNYINLFLSQVFVIQKSPPPIVRPSAPPPPIPEQPKAGIVEQMKQQIAKTTNKS